MMKGYVKPTNMYNKVRHADFIIEALSYSSYKIGLFWPSYLFGPLIYHYYLLGFISKEQLGLSSVEKPVRQAGDVKKRARQ